MINFDAVIVGGGVIGSCISYYLTKVGLKVALVEKKDIASGTSSSCDGNILISDKKPGFDTDLAAISQNLHKELDQKLDYEFDYTQKGSLYLIESNKEWSVAKQYVKEQTANGYSMRMLDYDQVHNDEPLLADDIIGGVETETDSAVYPMAFVYSLIDQACKNGLKLYNYNSVVDVKLGTKGQVESVLLLGGEKIKTDNVINAAGVWAPEIGDMVGIDIPIRPRQGQILVAEKTKQVGRRKIVEFGYMMAKFGGKNYKRNINPVLEKHGIAFVYEPTAADNFLIGSSRQFVGFNTKTSIEVIKGLAARAIRFFPSMKDINVIRSYAGLRPYVDDHFPIVSSVKSVPGFYIAAGHEGDGIGLAPVTGKLVEYLLTDKKLDIPLDLDYAIQRLSFNRFS
ncbi:MAG: FAD-binding oxidoreductase [Halanaerobiales bacterium]|nr:FAD-binding oxidoreductase [Halanaerobiales bacterium]